MNEEWYILPLVRQWVSRIAVGARYALWAMAILAVVELVCYLGGVILVGVAAGLVSQVLVWVCTLLLALLMPWCHMVLLAERGVELMRYLAWLNVFFAGGLVLCFGYTLATSDLLMVNQGYWPALVSLLTFCIMLVNVVKMAAAPVHVQVRLVVVPLVILVIYVIDSQGFVLLSCLFKLVLAWMLTSPLRWLASAAPAIIALPPKED